MREALYNLANVIADAYMEFSERATAGLDHEFFHSEGVIAYLTEMGWDLTGYSDDDDEEEDG